ncbi:GerMN domain-containing protein [Streptomyces roseirectus]|uniref:GerMN domain-containing protein n=1 Tax=Streptomyces roseirectus TaxID=2768066 RepID=A0A7H0I793_9ACTN|nr:GerMN domain-containing protein [Streptomyces roseirectus]QNP68659.1 GerMN domain-containing protein [Streptomyces roseirectus]
MIAARRALPALALLALPSCGIPTTGIPATDVVEAGPPATGIAPVAAVYFVRGGALTPVLRLTEAPGDPEAALALLLGGPPAEDHVTSELPAVGLGPQDQPAPAEPAAPAVSVDGNAITVRLPAEIRNVNALAVAQVVCTVAAARRMTSRDSSPVTVDLSAGGVRLARESDARCPQPGNA